MVLSLFTVNVWAVLVAGAAYFLTGAVWYGVFAEPWMAGIGKTRDQLQSRPIDYVVSLICEIGVAYGVAVGLNAFAATGVAEAIFVAATLWFAFSLLPAIVHYAYEERRLSLLFINKGYDLVGMVVAATILSVWV